MLFWIRKIFNNSTPKLQTPAAYYNMKYSMRQRMAVDEQRLVVPRAPHAELFQARAQARISRLRYFVLQMRRCNEKLRVARRIVERRASVFPRPPARKPIPYYDLENPVDRFNAGCQTDTLVIHVPKYDMRQEQYGQAQR